MDVNNKYYHGVRMFYGPEVDKIRETFANILENRKIMSREKLSNLGIEYPNRCKNQNENEICIATHRSIPDNRFEKLSIIDAYEEYIYPCLSFVLKETLLDDRDYEIVGDIHEIRIKDEIDLDDYLCAIAMPNNGMEANINHIYERIIAGENVTKSDMILFTEGMIQKLIDEYEYVKSVLALYNYENIPIIENEYGNNYDIVGITKKLSKIIEYKKNL